MIDVEMKKFIMQLEYDKGSFHIEFDTEEDEKKFKEIFKEKMKYDIADVFKPSTSHCLSLLFNQNVYWHYYGTSKIFQIKFDTNQFIDFNSDEWKEVLQKCQIYYTASGKLAGNKKMLDNFLQYCREKHLNIKIIKDKLLF